MTSNPTVFRNLTTTAVALLTLGALARAAGADDAKPPETNVLHDESEAGIVITSGNSSSDSLNFQQKNSYIWDLNSLRFYGKYLEASSGDLDTAKYWTLGLRYERGLTDSVAAFVGQNVESDVFSGYVQRYNTDFGGKYAIYKEESFRWNVEAGYRYTIENRLTGQKDQNYLRFFTEATRDWTKTASTHASIEYLPNLTDTSDYQLNTELSISGALNDILAIKAGYVIKYRNVPPPPATKNTDSQFTTALVAKF